MNVSGLDKHPVLDVSTATTVGQIDDVVIDPASRAVLGFLLRKTPAKATWLSWANIKSLGTDAATIDNVDVLADGPGPEAAPALKKQKVIGGRVLTDEGLELGRLADVEFEPDSGAVTSLVLADGRALPGSLLLGIGSYATVVGHTDSAS